MTDVERTMDAIHRALIDAGFDPTVAAVVADGAEAGYLWLPAGEVVRLLKIIRRGIDVEPRPGWPAVVVSTRQGPFDHNRGER